MKVKKKTQQNIIQPRARLKNKKEKEKNPNTDLVITLRNGNSEEGVDLGAPLSPETQEQNPVAQQAILGKEKWNFLSKEGIIRKTDNTIPEKKLTKEQTLIHKEITTQKTEKKTDPGITPPGLVLDHVDMSVSLIDQPKTLNLKC